MPTRVDGTAIVILIILIIVVVVLSERDICLYLRYILAGSREEGERSGERASDVKVSFARTPRRPDDDTIREVNCDRSREPSRDFNGISNDDARSSIFLCAPTFSPVDTEHLCNVTCMLYYIYIVECEILT